MGGNTNDNLIQYKNSNLVAKCIKCNNYFVLYNLKFKSVLEL